MPPILRYLLGTFILATLASGVCMQVKYRITSRHLEVRLFGICLRRIALDDIRYISKHRSGRGELWWNTLFPTKRILVIRRRTGWFRNFIITPKDRYVFKAQLKQAMRESAANATHS